MPKRKLKKGKVFWLAKDEDRSNPYNVNNNEMFPNEMGWIYKSKAGFCAELFEELTGIKLQDRQQIKVRMVEVK